MISKRKLERFLQEEDGVTVIEIILVLVGIFTT